MACSRCKATHEHVHSTVASQLPPTLRSTLCRHFALAHHKGSAYRGAGYLTRLLLLQVQPKELLRPVVADLVQSRVRNSQLVHTVEDVPTVDVSLDSSRLLVI